MACKRVNRRMGKSGMRTIEICDGKPARIVGSPTRKRRKKAKRGKKRSRKRR